MVATKPTETKPRRKSAVGPDDSLCCHHCNSGHGGGGGGRGVDEKSPAGFALVELYSFCNDVSVVGMRQLVRSSTSFIRPAFWMLLILGGTALMIYHFQDRANYYLSYPTDVAVSVEYLHEIRFPTTIICNENRVGKRVADLFNSVEIIESLFPPFPSTSFVPDWLAYDILVRTLKLDWSIIYGNSGQTPQQAILSCSFNSQPCKTDTDFIRIPTDFAMCLAFNTASWNYSCKSTGASSGLQMILYVDQDDYLVTNSYSAGFRVLLQEPNETPLVTQMAFKISPGVTTQVAVETNVMSELPAPYGTCNDSLNYTQTQCMAKCQGDYVMKACNCRDLAQPGNVGICSPKDYYNCWFPAMKKFITDNVGRTCGCRRQCKKTTYNYVVTQSVFSEYMISQLSKTWGFNMSSLEWRRNYAALEIYFSELKTTYTTSSPAYSRFSLLCDLGGAMGLVLGSTVLTFFEFFDFVVTLIVARVKQNAEKRRKSEELRAGVEASSPSDDDVNETSMSTAAVV